MTDRERAVLELAIKLRQAKYVVEEAFIRQEYNHAVDMLIRERRDAKTENVKDGQASVQ